MNCQEALDLLYEYLDKETSEINARQIKDHLDHCRDCFEKYRLEEDLQKFIDLKLGPEKNLKCPNEVKKRILDTLDSIDGETAATGSPRRRRPFLGSAYVLAAAAALVIVVGAALMAAGIYRHMVLYSPLENSHFRVEQSTAAYEETPNIQSAFQYASTLGYKMAPSFGDYSMLGARTEEIKHAEAAHFVYKNPQGQFISVFVLPAAGFSIPDGLQKTEVDKGGFKFFDHHCRGCRLMYHRDGNAIVVTASEDHTADLASFLPGGSSI